MMFPRFLGPVVRGAVLAAALAFNTGCAGVTPAQVVSEVGSLVPVGCQMVGVVSGNATAGAVCSDVANAVQAILTTLKLEAATAPTVGPQKFVPVQVGARIVGYVRSDLAAAVQKKLSAPMAVPPPPPVVVVPAPVVVAPAPPPPAPVVVVVPPPPAKKVVVVHKQSAGSALPRQHLPGKRVVVAVPPVCVPGCVPAK